MPAYDFEDTQTGEVVEMVFGMAEVPPIGETVEHDGRTLRRLVSRYRVSDRGFTPFASSRMEPWDPHSPRHDAEGRPVFNSKAEVLERNAKAAADPKAQKFEWDP